MRNYATSVPVWSFCTAGAYRTDEKDNTSGSCSGFYGTLETLGIHAGNATGIVGVPIQD